MADLTSFSNPAQAPDSWWTDNLPDGADPSIFAPPDTTMPTPDQAPNTPVAPGILDPWTPPWTESYSPVTAAPTPFSAPTFEQAQASDPGWRWRLEQGLKALQGSAAARGTLLTGGTMKSLSDYAGNQASAEYQNAWQRAYQPWSAEQGFGLQAAGINAQQNQAAYNSRLQNYLLERENYYNNQDRPYEKLMQMLGLGMNAASGSNASNALYGNQGSDLLTGAGNARAAGTMGRANAWGQTLGNIGNLGQSMYLQSLLGQNKSNDTVMGNYGAWSNRAFDPSWSLPGNM